MQKADSAILDTYLAEINKWKSIENVLQDLCELLVGGITLGDNSLVFVEVCGNVWKFREILEQHFPRIVPAVIGMSKHKHHATLLVVLY